MRVTEATVPLGEQLRIAWANKPFVVLIAANIVQYISAGIGYAGGFFFMSYGLGLTFEVYNIIPIWILWISGASIVSMPLCRAISLIHPPGYVIFTLHCRAICDMIPSMA